MIVPPVQRLPDRIYGDILGRIVEGEFKVGDKLPTEQEFAHRFQTSRPTVRAALARLRADGIIVTRHGSGTTVARCPDPDVRRFAPFETLSDIQRCYEFRIILETGAAGLAAQNADAAAIEEIERAYELLQQIIKSRAIGVREDFLFHMALARASRNQYLASAISFLQEQIEISISLARNLSLVKSMERQQQVQADHLAILNAIKAQDSNAASQAMRHHLESARLRMFGT